jgi:uncharacterized membrane protein
MVRDSSSVLPEHISQHVETIAQLRARGESGVGFHQRTIEKVTANLGRPLFLNLVLAGLAFWVLANIYPRQIGIVPFDSPPFPLLSGVVSTGGLLLAILILITQNRQARVAERNAQLDLQVNLLAEQKITKLIALVEELRHDLPSVRDRHDPEAEAMAEATDPHAVLDALEEKLDESVDLVGNVKDKTP